ncbi:MAG: hypothetical protein CVV05_19090 [Gammaproteobacteria bacterium HGW-Gammaproteobacteria-1]|jgi:hypothetical protein|nr:MAG: hypothetical protein CVV05_19090 [Gammaproteobacteria bacterium HGW-Gammaproteobacteria-1]
MSDQDKLARLIDDLSQTRPAMYAIAERARRTIHAAVPDTTERVMYGGFMFAAPQDFCGVFVYAQHVSVEFGAGAELDDPLGVLEGKGKFRRHIKLRTVEDIKARHLRDYVLRASELMRD